MAMNQWPSHKQRKIAVAAIPHSDVRTKPAVCGPNHLKLFVVLACCFTGCSRGPERTTVQGKVTYKGAPVTFGIINFQPAAGKPAGGELNPDGSFSFQLQPGEYQVRIDSPPQMPEGYKEGDPPPKLGPRQLPVSYSNYATSGLTANIGDKSPQQLDFALP
jgi:hypothetical protein